MTTLTRAQPVTENRFVIDSVPWRAYELIGRAFRDRPIKLTYDCGRLEIMTTSFRHERLKCLLRRLLDARERPLS